MPLSIDIQRIQSDIERIAQFGFNASDGGIYRPGFSDADMQARRWLEEHYQREGLSARIDAVGNVLGRYGDGAGPAVWVGSHLDSVPCAGQLDGILGVVCGLECVRTLRDHQVSLRHPIQLVATSEEEGRFGGMLGAQVLTGALDQEWFHQAQSADGILLKDAMQAQGFEPDQVGTATRSPDEMLAFLELHIEQGPVLEASGEAIGVVDAIAGIFNWLITFEGRADHSGTTPMNMRQDAFSGVAAFSQRIDAIINDVGTDRTRMTIGRVDVEPNHPHTVPGRCSFSLVGRDTDAEVMQALADHSKKELARIADEQRLTVKHTELSWLKPKQCSKRVVDTFIQSARARGHSYRVMPSGAGHDTQFFTDVTDAGLIFVPSHAGASHSPLEHTTWPEIERGCEVLLDTLIALGS